MSLLLGLYLAGAVVGLAATDARWPWRIGVALLWPLGPIAFVVTVTVLIGASFIAFPLVGGLILAGALGATLLTLALT